MVIPSEIPHGKRVLVTEGEPPSAGFDPPPFQLMIFTHFLPGSLVLVETVEEYLESHLENPS